VSTETLTSIVKLAERAQTYKDPRMLAQAVVELALAVKQLAAERERQERTRQATLAGLERGGGR
jgi:hypothetical protein